MRGKGHVPIELFEGTEYDDVSKFFKVNQSTATQLIQEENCELKADAELMELSCVDETFLMHFDFF